MALSKTVLGALMSTKVQAIPGITITSVSELEAYLNAIADAVVTHVTGAAVVTVTTSTPGATAGPATLPGTGTGVVT